MENNYVCTLDEASKTKAEQELGEDEAQRMSAMKTLLKWLTDRRGWINVPTDPNYLLGFLRMRKFNQLTTRENLVTAWELRMKHPQWYANIDTTGEALQKVLSTGFYYPLPGRDRMGRKVIMLKNGNIDTSGKDYGSDDATRGCLLLHDYLSRDENVQVNGCVYFLDLTGYTMKHIQFTGLGSLNVVPKCWAKCHSGRNKELHFYNGGSIFDILYGIIKSSLSQKIQNRVINHGSNLFEIYDYIDKYMLPDEYLPDDYTGPSAGPRQNIIDDYLRSLQSPDVRDYLKDLSSGRYFVDADKKPKTGEEETASYRPIVAS